MVNNCDECRFYYVERDTNYCCCNVEQEEKGAPKIDTENNDFESYWVGEKVCPYKDDGEE